MNQADDTPPDDEVARAKWTIKRLVKATTGQDISDAEVEKLWATAQERLKKAMADVTPGSPA